MSHKLIKIAAFVLAGVMTTSLIFIAEPANAIVFGDGTGDGIMKVNTTATSNAKETAQLKLVTSSVKKTLGLDNSWTEFNGEPYTSTIRKLWRLYWYKEGDALYVTATDSGKIVNYSRQIESEDDEVAPLYNSMSKYDPKFTTDYSELNKEAALDFLSKVMDDNETADITPSHYYFYKANNKSTRFSGVIKINDLDTPLYVHITVNNGVVTDFSRNDQSEYPGEIGDPTGISLKASKEVKNKLKSVIDFNIEWEYDSDTKEAHLRYLPNFSNTHFVDALTGNLINKTDIQDTLDKNESSNIGMGSSGGLEAGGSEEDSWLSEAELEGVDKIKDMLTPEQLDKKLKTNYPELGLASKELTLTDSSYHIDRETGEITATLTYSKKLNKGVVRRTVIVNGKTGEFIEVWGSHPYDETKINSKSSKALKIAQDFIAKVYPDGYKVVELYKDNESTTKSEGYSYIFAVKNQGYFLKDSAIYITVDASDFTIKRASNSIIEDVKFDNVSNIISTDKAKDIWLNSYSTDLSYVPVPVAIDLVNPKYLLFDLKFYNESGYDYVNSLRLGYQMGYRENDYYAIDALTGGLLEHRWYGSNAKINYTDLAGNEYAKQFERLSAMNIGYSDGKSTGKLTQLDMLALLCSAQAGAINMTDESRVNAVYNWAYSFGTITKDEKSESKQLTNLDAVKMLVNTLGYKKIASMSSMYTSNTKDFASVGAADKGYVAIAHNLGIIKTDGEINDAATRQTGLMVLYNFMESNT